MEGRDTEETRTNRSTTVFRAVTIGGIVVGAALAAPLTPSAIAQDGDPSGGIAGYPGQRYDSDWDGLDDQTESFYGINPYNPDTDGDGLRDGDEFYDRYARSDPTLYDTDFDGLGDGAEVFTYGTDPILYDTDSDGRGDGIDPEPLNPFN